MHWVSPALHAKIRVVPNCVRAEFAPSPRPFDAHAPVFLQVGTGWNKNLERVVEALRGIDCTLAVVGPLSEAQRAQVEAAGVRFISHGRVSDEELVAVYKACDAVIFVSLFEGFGLPIVEAQATGRAGVTTDPSAKPEAAGEAAGGQVGRGAGGVAGVGRAQSQRRRLRTVVACGSAHEPLPCVARAVVDHRMGASAGETIVPEVDHEVTVCAQVVRKPP